MRLATGERMHEFPVITDRLPSSPDSYVQLLAGTRREKIATGVKIGMSAGVTSHRTAGFAMKKAAAASPATAKEIRMGIFRAHVGTGSNCTPVPPRNASRD
jgi:hypothetical protein